MSTLRDALVVPEPVGLCAFGRIAESLNEEDQAALKVAISRVLSEPDTNRYRRYSIVWLTKTLTDNGYPIGRTAVSKHLTKGCCCDDPF